MNEGPMDLRTLARAYDRSAATYDERFRALQRPKYRAAIALLDASPLALRALASTGVVLDAGAGTGLFAEWLLGEADGEDGALARSPGRELLRAALQSGDLVALDASVEMVRRAAPRPARPLAADLARPPLRAQSCKAIVAFTALLENVPASLRALSSLLGPGGVFLCSFLQRESPAPESLARWSSLKPTSAPLAAGQDLVHLLTRE